MSDLIQSLVQNASLSLQARRHYAETDSYQSILATRHRRYHHFFAPLNGDQWPWDAGQRPGMIHITHNIIAPAVYTESRIEAILPRLALLAETDDEGERTRAEMAEKIFIRWLELSDWEAWLPEATLAKSVYGKVILKPVWNKADNRPDVSIIDTPSNLRLGYGSSDYKTVDWALYEYSISPFEAMRRFPDIVVQPPQRAGGQLRVQAVQDHADPLNQMQAINESTPVLNRMNQFQPSDYEGKQVKVWDYWYKDEAGTPINAFFVEGVLAAAPKAHSYYPDIPFIVIQHDTEPGNPEGIGDVEPLIDIQLQLNRALSHYAQLIQDEVDPAWQIDADNVPSGVVPAGGQIIAAGEGKTIQPLAKSVNNFPIDQLITALMNAFHLRSGLAEVLFSMPPGAQTAGRSLQIQIEASANRIDPRRRRLYRGLKDLLIYWAYMVEKIDPTVQVGPETVHVRDTIQGFRRWRFIAPEITPRDSLELITAVVNKLNAKLISLEDAMDELGVDSPLEMIRKIEAERTNAKLFPGDAQAFLAVIAMIQQQMAQAQAAGVQGPDLSGNLPGGGGPGGQPGPGQGTPPNGGAPAGVQGDNGSGVPQPNPAAGPGGLQNQTLVRAQPSGGAQVLQQIRTVNG